jgi:hypothetical protein
MELSHAHLDDLGTGILGNVSVLNGVEKPDSIFDATASESALYIHMSQILMSTPNVLAKTHQDDMPFHLCTEGKNKISYHI